MVQRRPMHLVIHSMLVVLALGLSSVAAHAQLCPPGKYSLTGSEPCLDCVAGTYNDQFGATYCTVCSPGTFSSVPGATACLSCPDGKIAPTLGSTSCTTCPVGKTSNVDHTACISVAPGAGKFAQVAMALLILSSAMLFIRRRDTA